MGAKFIMEFTNVQFDTCVVSFDFADYNDDPVKIYGGARPFVLGEFNSDDDILKPVRPQQATMEILASASGIDMEDFLTDNDTDVLVKFDFGFNLGYWYGYLSQEDIQETWIGTNHILILRADDGIGRLKQVALQNNGANIVGTYTPYDFIEYAMQNAVPRFGRNTVYSNLFHTSMVSTSNQTGLDQCTIDARTFEQSVGQFDDAYTMLEKINRSWSQTLFQYLGDFLILRVEELFTDQDLAGFKFNTPTPGQRASRNRRYDIEVGVEQKVKPIAPEMIKTYQKPSKQTTIKYNYDQFVQVLCNESFQSGSFIDTGTITIFGDVYEYDKFSVDLWSHEKDSITSPSASSKEFYRYSLYRDSKFADDYIVIERETSGNSWIKSCLTYIQAGDKLNISIEHGWTTSAIVLRSDIMYIVLSGDDGNTYTVNDDGEWKQVVAPSNTYYAITDLGAAAGGWRTRELETEQTTVSGNIYVYLWKDNGFGFTSVDRKFKNLDFQIIPQLLTSARRRIKGDYDRYTIQKNIIKNYEETIYLDDFESKYYKGAITEMDGVTLTGDQWFRRRYSSERYTFKRQHALARWFMNRSYKMKLEASFFGLKFGSNDEAIGLINTIKFVDDAPTKIFWISNMSEIDFMNCTWSATLMEVFDSSVTDNTPTDQDVHTFDFYYE
jgi:hypothetical protein